MNRSAAGLPASDRPSQPARLVSLDALRGFVMFWIIGGDALGGALKELAGGEAAPSFIKMLAAQLEHVRWEGFVFYDLIFPLFVFMVGMAAVLSLSKALETAGMAGAMKRIFRRAVLLVLLGAIYDALDSFYNDGMRGALQENLLCGVLQRIGYCYLFTGLMLCRFRKRGLVTAFVLLMGVYAAVLSLVPAPGRETVSFERRENIIQYLDLYIPPYFETDPESFMTTFPAIATCLLGAFAGFFVRDSKYPPVKQAAILVAVGAATTALGYLWGLQLPVIKRLWTPSYVLVAGGYSLMLLGLFIWLIDVRQWRWWIPPFIWIGANSIGAYFFDNIVNLRAWAGYVMGRDAISPGTEAVLAVAGLLLTIAFVHELYRRRIFLRV